MFEKDYDKDERDGRVEKVDHRHFDTTMVDKIKAIAGLTDAQKIEIDRILGWYTGATLDPNAPGGPAPGAPPAVKQP